LCGEDNGFTKNVSSLSALVYVLPKGRFGEMISFEFNFGKTVQKAQKPLWFMGFPNRYLFRFALLASCADLDIAFIYDFQSVRL
jgi:hypothetical protein